MGADVVVSAVGIQVAREFIGDFDILAKEAVELGIDA